MESTFSCQHFFPFNATPVTIGFPDSGIHDSLHGWLCVLIFNAVLKLWKSAVKDVWGLLIFLAVLAASLLTSLSPVWYVLAAGVAGVLIQNLKGAKK